MEAFALAVDGHGTLVVGPFPYYGIIPNDPGLRAQLKQIATMVVFGGTIVHR